MSSSEIPVVDLNIEEQLSLSEDNYVRAENEVNFKIIRDQLADNSVNTDSIEDQSERQPRSARDRILTEKGQAYQEQRQREREKEEDHLVRKFNEAYETWKVQATEIESSLASQLPSSQMEKGEKVINLNGLREDVHKAYEKLRQVRLPGQELLRKVDTCDAFTRSLQHQFDLQSFK